jgi:hypothetical protein
LVQLRFRRVSRKFLGWLATGFGAVALVLATIVGAQAEVLYDKGSRLAMGIVPEWMAGFGTMFTAVAAAAAFLSFRVAARERQSLEKERQAADHERRALAAVREAERRDQIMAQARRILPVRVVHDPSLTLPQRRSRFEWVIQNRSDEAISDLHIDLVSPKDRLVTVEEYVPPERDPDGVVTYKHPADIPVLLPGDATPPLRVVISGYGSASHVEYICFTFTDVRGNRWRRLGNEQPAQILDGQPISGA